MKINNGINPSSVTFGDTSSSEEVNYRNEVLKKWKNILQENMTLR